MKRFITPSLCSFCLTILIENSNLSTQRLFVID